MAFKFLLSVTILVTLWGSLFAQRPSSKASGSQSSQTVSSQGQTGKEVGTVYDLLYALGAAPSTLNPSTFLVDCVRNRKPGMALDLGSGNGRNSLYLARHGWSVTAVDLSRVGLDQTRMSADQLGIRIDTIAADVNDFDFGHDRWDLILLIDFPFAYQNLLPRIREGLRPGGWVVIEDVSVREEAELRKIPGQSPPLQYTFMRRADLDHAFADFHVLRDQEGFFANPWGGHAWLIRYLAEKPSIAAAEKNGTRSPS